MTNPHTTVVLAMSVDGKIADIRRSPARFGSPADKAHLEKQIALADGVLFGAGTLRAYGTTLRVSNPQLLELRQTQQKPLQPIQFVVSASGKIDPNLRFFQQPIPRGLLTTTLGAQPWIQPQTQGKFAQILIAETDSGTIDWVKAFQQIRLERLVILGGGQLVASLLAEDLIDEFWLTLCPVLMGGEDAPTPVEGQGLIPLRRLQLLSVETDHCEVFLHYALQSGPEA